MNDLPFTGERFVPGTTGEIWVEHWHRYHFAARWAAGKRVLDVACGEGYGTALLARHAAQVTGVDVSPDAIGHAQREYAGVANARFVQASCTAIPLPDASIDVAVSFETLEHIAEQEAFLDELARVLVPGGVLVLSCPNKLEYTDRRNFANEFHVKELYREELAALVAPRFPHAQWYGQRPTFYSLIAPERMDGAGAQLVEVDEARPAEASAQLSAALYFMIVASRDPAALAATPPALSVLADRGDWVRQDYEKVYRLLTHTAKDRDDYVKLVSKHVETLTGLEEQIANLRTAIQLQEQALAAREALAQAQAALHEAALAEKQREVDRRRGWRWWLKLPLIRLGLMK
ncbi:MAG TPA: class I SAM-dependent methyltransferase [Usitatibacter sp.]|nr:class I SAM-dependent methyltransferase [Usitatibacter sp.]